MVPLIALDELPSFVSIQGVPRQLTALEITGMHSVGVFEARQQQHVVEGVYSNAPPTRERIVNSSTNSDQSVSTNTDASASIPTTTTNDLPPTATLGKKTYCAYWMKYGECSFVQTGCKYKHEMPHDLEKLNSLGFSEIPQWYRNLYGTPLLNLPDGVGAPSYSIRDSKAQKSDNWRKDRALNQNANGREIGAPSGQRYTRRATRGTGRPIHYGDKDKDKAKQAAPQDKEREAREAQEAQALAKARDKEDEKRRKANQERWPGLSPGAHSIFKHCPAASDVWDSEAECSQLLSDDEKYELMSDDEFQREEDARRAALAALSSASASSTAFGSPSTRQTSSDSRRRRPGANRRNRGNQSSVRRGAHRGSKDTGNGKAN